MFSKQSLKSNTGAADRLALAECVNVGNESLIDTFMVRFLIEGNLRLRGVFNVFPPLMIVFPLAGH